MKSDVYRLVTVDDGKSDTAAIIKVLSEMASGRLKSDIRLLNYYHELPVSYGAAINAMENDSVELAIHEHQAVIIKNDNITLIKSKHFHNELAVHCYAAYVNVPKKKVILHNFAYAQVRAERRESVRVKVNGRLPVLFSCENMKIEGTMVDISGSGLSVLSAVVPAISDEQAGGLSFTLVGKSLEVPGSFVRVVSHDGAGYICIFKMNLDRMSDNVVSKFIYERQVEIIQELKEGLIAV